MKKNKKILIITGISIIVIALLTIIYVVLTTPDKNTTLTAIEKRYISKNKNTVINIAVPNDVPVFGLSGAGVFFDFIDDFIKDIELELNKVPYNANEEPSLYDYKIELSDEVRKDQILIYQDYYVALSNEYIKLNNIQELNKTSIGCLENKVDKITYYLEGIDASYTKKDNVTSLLEGLEKDEYDVVIIPYMMYIDNILGEKYNVVYNFDDLKENYCLTLSDSNKEVNEIMRKYFTLWKQNNYISSYNKAYNSLYNSVKDIKSKDQAQLVGKVYRYGYVENLPFEGIINKKLVGINGEYINNFSTLTGAEFKFKKYDSISDLIKAYNEDEIDILFNNFNTSNTLSNAYQTVSPYKEDYVILTNIKNNQIMDSLKSLKDKTVYALEDSDLATLIKINTEANLKTFKNYGILLKNLKNEMLIIIDSDIYDYYKNNELKDYYVVYSNKFENTYNFIIKNNESNNTLLQMFNDFISSQNYDYVKVSAFQNIIVNPKNQTLSQTILNYILFIVLPILIILTILGIIFKKKKEVNIIKKDEKLRYLDMMTSLKNRNYLNANISKWDETKIYPQTIIIIDLNNIKYINDNFGHEEGDNEIKSAANILIKTQLENSDIIRTDGNEFLIYLIGYKEDQIISYMRKLYKAMRELPHGYGAAFGYSMIEDDMKLLDDAINEATLDMRSNKES